MSDEWSAYNEDPREACKYGSDCYRKNLQHLSTYKHPPKVTERRAEKRSSRHSSEPEEDNIKRKKVEVDPLPVAQEKITEESSNNTIKPGQVDNKTTEESSNNTINPGQVENKTTEETTNNTINKIDLPKDITYYKSDDHAVLKELFLVEMPDDFFKFFEYLNEDGAIEKTLASVNLELIGPYDLLLGRLPKLDNKELYLIHWRFFYDPPEFQAVLKKRGKSEYHIGYFRDAPDEKPAFVGSNDSAKDCHITILADNIFGAVYQYLQKEKTHYPVMAKVYQKLMDSIKKYCEKDNVFSIKMFDLKKRKTAQVANTLHHAGIVVPYNKKTTLGYRRLVETDENIRKIFAKLKNATTQNAKDEVLSELQTIIAYASIAIDEYDFGTGLELGIDLFCSGLKELDLSTLSNLTTAYSLLNRESFNKIIEAHLKYRRKGPNMSVLA